MLLAAPGQLLAHNEIPTNLPTPEPPNPPPPPPCENAGGGDCPDVCNPIGSGGNVSYLTGAEHEIKTDIVVDGAYPIRMVRQYVSSSTYDSNLGYGWAFNHNKRLFEYPDGSVVIRTGCGVNYKYIFTGGAYQTTAGGTPSTLVKNPDGSFDVSYHGGRRDHFDSQGNLAVTYDVQGNSLRYTYDSRGKLPLTGSTPFGVDPSVPITVAYTHRLEKIEAFRVGGAATGKYVTFNYNETTGRLTGITSSDGRTVTYLHDVSTGINRGNLEQVNGLEGIVTTYKYEDYVAGTTNHQDYHNITEIKNSVDSTPILLEYNADDRVIKETYGNKVFTFDWTQLGVQTIVTETNTDDQGENPTVATRIYKFDIVGYVEDIIDALGNRIHYDVDANGRHTREEYYEEQGTPQAPNPVLVKVIDRPYSSSGLKQSETITLDSGETISKTWTYDDTLVATEEAVSSNAPEKVFKSETIYNHDASNKPTTVQLERRYKDDGTYLETSYTYNANGDVLTTTLPDGHVIVNKYGVAYGGKYVTKTYHEIVAVPVPDLEETYQYDNKGNRTHVTDARGHTTVTTYDDKNRQKTVTNHLGHLTTYVYDANDNLEQIKRDRSLPGDQLDITKLTYNGENRLVKIERTDSTGAFVTRTTMRYDSAGNAIARGDAYGNETTLRYDLENRLTRITDATGNYIEYTLNALGHRTKTEYFEAGGVLTRTSSAVFDDLNRQEQVIGALNQTTTFTYDAMGNRITATDALSRPTTVYTYDTLSRLTNILDANGKNTVYEYDERDQLRYVTDPRGLITEYQYNELGQLRFLTSPDTGITEYTYDLAGNRETQKDARNITVTYGYDALNRVTGKTYPTAALNVSYTYDERTNGLGKLTGMSDAEGATEYDYDEYGNLKETRRTASGQTYTTQYGYDSNDRLNSITYPSGRVVTYIRNTLGQVTSVTTTPNGGTEETVASGISYIPFGTLEDMTFGNTLMLDQTYDTDYRLTGQVLGSVYSRTYGYDDVNNIKAITDNIAAAKNQDFNYDNLDRLDDATSTGIYGALDYGYDNVGNRISLKLDGGAPTTYNYDPAANQLDNTTGTDVHSFSYDANGNTQTKDAFTFTYDDTNRMAQVTDGASTTSYGFNGKGERVRKSGTATTLFHYDNAGNLLFESDTAGNTQVEYIWLGSQRLAMVSGGALYYTHVDHLGTPQLLTDGAGAVAWQAEYDPFGKATVTVASVTNNLRFPGQYYDGETGLHYNYFRDYDPGTGRYVESDPIGLGDGMNTYTYVSANPLSYSDVSARSKIPCGCREETKSECFRRNDSELSECLNDCEFFKPISKLCKKYKILKKLHICTGLKGGTRVCERRCRNIYKGYDNCLPPNKPKIICD